MIDIACMEN